MCNHNRIHLHTGECAALFSLPGFEKRLRMHAIRSPIAKRAGIISY